MIKLLINKLRKNLIKIIEFYLPNKYHLPFRLFYYRSRNLLDPEMLYIEKIIESNERFLEYRCISLEFILYKFVDKPVILSMGSHIMLFF